MGGSSGPLAAYTLADGKEKWKWTEEGSEYASPVLLKVGDTKMVVAEGSKNLVGLSLADGKLLWKTALGGGGMGSYIASTPMVQGETVFFAGGGSKAVKIEKTGDEFKPKEQWSNTGAAVVMNTPVVTNGLVFGLGSDDKLFCLKADDGKTAWKSEGVGGRVGRNVFGSVVDAGSGLFALTPAGDLIVFEPSDKEFKQLAKYKVGTGTYAYPIVSGNRIFVKDKDSLILWTIE
jgi:outer membrane protein assembly factor BamB